MRLTVTNQNIGAIDSSTLPSYVALYERLKEYEDLEEQNKLLKLPCTVDDTVFYLFPNDDRKWYIDEMKVCFISMQESQRERMICDIRLENNDAKAYASLCDFGKMVFLTREEAEAALKEMSE